MRRPGWRANSPPCGPTRCAAKRWWHTCARCSASRRTTSRACCSNRPATSPSGAPCARCCRPWVCSKRRRVAPCRASQPGSDCCAIPWPGSRRMCARCWSMSPAARPCSMPCATCWAFTTWACRRWRCRSAVVSPCMCRRWAVWRCGSTRASPVRSRLAATSRWNCRRAPRRSHCACSPMRWPPASDFRSICRRARPQRSGAWPLTSATARAPPPTPRCRWCPCPPTCPRGSAICCRASRSPRWPVPCWMVWCCHACPNSPVCCRPSGWLRAPWAVSVRACATWRAWWPIHWAGCNPRPRCSARAPPAPGWSWTRRA